MFDGIQLRKDIHTRTHTPTTELTKQFQFWFPTKKIEFSFFYNLKNDTKMSLCYRRSEGEGAGSSDIYLPCSTIVVQAEILAERMCHVNCAILWTVTAGGLKTPDGGPQ